jgi:regulator of protease activity HflC (stomatin/prohibitin superfamily)
MNRRSSCIMGAVIAGVGLIVILLVLSVYTVPAGYVGVITRWGAVNRVAYPGLGIKIPIAEGIVKLDTRVQKDQVDTAAASYDMQQVSATIATNFRIDSQYAVSLYQNIGADYKTKVVDPAIQDTFKKTTAQYVAPDLLQKRDEVSKAALDALQSKLSPYHIIVDNFNIVNFDFSQVYNDAIEAKQVAAQQVETAKQQLAKAQVDAQAQVAAAQGQADAQKVLKDTGGLSAEYLQFLALQKWDGHLPQVTGGSMPFIDVSSFALPTSTVTTP